jgi:hypothetical protein
MADFPFKSYCWALGTTSFRTSDFNVRIERQLDLLDRFRETNTGDWQSLQIPYYRFMQSDGFIGGDASNPAKDAREKTAGLVKIGLIDGERRVTAAGRSLLGLSRAGDFKKDNALQIPADSFIYLKQLLKTSDDRCGAPVRPYVVLAYALAKFGDLSDEEYTYLLPLCVDEKRTADIIAAIPLIRANEKSMDDIIVNTLLGMDNYKAALAYLLKAKTVTADVIMAIGMNRKSGSGGAQGYDLPLFSLYETLYKIVFKRDADSVVMLLEQTAKIAGNAKAMWRKYLFRTFNRSAVKRDKLAALNDAPILMAKTEKAYRTEFFRLAHLFKAKATLADYADLNRRYFQTTDTVIFADGKVQLDTVPKRWFGEVADELLSIAFSECDALTDDVSLGEIAPFLEIDTLKLHADLERLFGVKIAGGEDVKEVIKRERYLRFNKLIDERFDRSALVDLLGKFENREDAAIRQYVTNNADMPTIFEYVIGIAWYHISGRRGDVLEYMNLSLEADLLPRTHAAGGNADIEWHYEQTAAYPKHALLLEATLADSANQRRMEMEPVSRHLGEYILSTGDTNAYCVFASTYLHRNVISDFRNRRTYGYYSDQYENAVYGLKILPLATAELRVILERGMSYETLYPKFEAAYMSDEPVPAWYGMFARQLSFMGEKVEDY